MIENMKAYKHDWYMKHRIEQLRRNREYAKRHRLELREYRREYMRRYRQKRSDKQ
jgi:hypothetical protein